MREKTFFNRREWLNSKSHYDTGAIHSKITADNYSVDGSVSIWDCGRKINLNFDVYKDKDFKVRIQKIDTLIEHLNLFREGLYDAKDYFDECERKRKEKK